MISNYLAEKIGVGLRHLMAIENEGKSPSYEVLNNLIHILSIPPNDIFYPDKKSDSPELDYLVLLLKKCGIKEIRAITALIEALLQE
jgi:transcriptional regulator with XRE-family HTH domain